MARICPFPLSGQTWTFFTDMATLTRPHAVLAGTGASLFLLDLERLGHLLSQPELAAELRAILTPAEAALFDGFFFPKRRLEWLGGRLAAKYCLQQLAGKTGLSAKQAAQLSILPDSHGVPLLRGLDPAGPPLRLSISHSAGYAGALLCLGDNCGLDIQKKTEKLQVVRERFVLPEEEPLLRDTEDELAALALLWASKEAIKKSLLPTDAVSFVAVRMEDMALEAGGRAWRVNCMIERNKEKIRAVVRAVWHQDHCIACTRGVCHA